MSFFSSPETFGTMGASAIPLWQRLENQMKAQLGGIIPLWLDGADTSTITATDGLGDQWRDKSGNGNHANGVTTTRPSTGVSTMNGRNVITFSSGTYLTISDHASLNQANGFCWFVVFKPTDIQNGYKIIIGREYSTTAREFYLGFYDVGADDRLYSSVSQADPASVWISNNGLVTESIVTNNTPMIVSVNGDANNLCGLATNKTEYDTIQNITGNFYDRPAGLNIIVGNNGLKNTPLIGDIAEILYFTRDLTAAERDLVGAYLGAKWGITYTTQESFNVCGLLSQSNLLNWSIDNANYTNEGQIAFKAALNSYFPRSIFCNCAVAGCAVHEASEAGYGFWINAADYTPSVLNLAWQAQAVNHALKQGNADYGRSWTLKRYDAVLSVCGETDAVAIAAETITKTQFKDALQAGFVDLYTKNPDIKIGVILTGRYSLADDAAVQAVREAQLELIAALDYVYLAGDPWGEALLDGVHYTAAGYTNIGDKAGKLTAAEFGKRSSAGLVGPVIASATYSGDTVTATVTLDNGSAISGSETGQFRITDDGVAATISSVAVSGTTITFTLSAAIEVGSTVKLWTNYGIGTGVTPANLVKDANGNLLQTTVELAVS